MFRSTLVRQTRNICSPVLRVSAKPTALRVSLSRPAIVKAPLRLMAAKAKAETTPTASFQASAWAQFFLGARAPCAEVSAQGETPAAAVQSLAKLLEHDAAMLKEHPAVFVRRV